MSHNSIINCLDNQQVCLKSNIKTNIKPLKPTYIILISSVCNMQTFDANNKIVLHITRILYSIFVCLLKSNTSTKNPQQQRTHQPKTEKQKTEKLDLHSLDFQHQPHVKFQLLNGISLSYTKDSENSCENEIQKEK